MAFYILPFTKNCSKCKFEFPLEEFHKQRTGKHGVASICKPCHTGKCKEWRLANPEKSKDLDRQKRQKKPELYKQLKKDWRKNNLEITRASSKKWREANREWYSAYDKKYKAANKDKLAEQRRNLYHSDLDQNRRKNREYYARSKERLEVVKKAWREANPEKVKNAMKRWQSANRDRYLEYKKQLQHRRRLQMKDGRCDFTIDQWNLIKEFYSNKCAFCRKDKKLTIDHVRPLSKGGEHTASNVIPLCMKCNQSKGSRPPTVTFQPHLFMGLNLS